MKTSIRGTLKQRGRPKTTGPGLGIQVRLHEPQLAALDRWIKAQPAPKPSRPEAIRRLAAEKLKSRGFFSAERRDEHARATGASHAEKAAGKAVDRALAGSGQSARVKAR